MVKNRLSHWSSLSYLQTPLNLQPFWNTTVKTPCLCRVVFSIYSLTRTTPWFTQGLQSTSQWTSKVSNSWSFKNLSEYTPVPLLWWSMALKLEFRKCSWELWHILSKLIPEQAILSYSVLSTASSLWYKNHCCFLDILPLVHHTPGKL